MSRQERTRTSRSSRWAFVAGTVIAFSHLSSPAWASEDTSAPRLVNGSFSLQYPEDAKAKGVQGVVTLAVDVRADGTVAKVDLVESSRSEQLDGAARAAFGTARFEPAKDESGAPIDASIKLPVAFYKDSVRTVLKKPCADLNADVAYYRATFPDNEIRQMRVASLTLSMLVLSNGSREFSLAAAKNFAQIFDATVAGCEAAPQENYEDSLARAIKTVLGPS